MRKEEKTRLTYERIMSAAIAEFGTKNYDHASITTLCSENQISKGLVYHNFKNKDELYLKCVARCFEEMTTYFKERDFACESVNESMKRLFQTREQFFNENPYYCNIFFNTVLQPPEHLRAEIRMLKREYEDFYIDWFKRLLEKLPLRSGITIDAAIEHFMMFFEIFNGYYQNKSGENADIYDLMKDHEGNLSKIMDIMLYGVAKEA